jgi:Ca2+-binding EF-hand superfamily protein
MFDLDSSGRIDVDELRSTAEQLGLQLTQVWKNDFFEPFLC